MKKKEDSQEVKAGTPYSKSQLLAAKRYTPAQKDILSAVLSGDQAYTHEQAQSLLESYLKKEVM